MGKKKIEDRMLSQIIYRSIFDIIDDETGNPSYRKYFDKVLKDIFGIDGIITSMMLSTNQFKFIKKLLADNEYKAFCQMMLRDEDVRSMKDLVRVAYDAAQIANKPKKRVSTNDIKAYRYLTKLYIKSIEAMRKKYKTDKSSKKAFKQKYSDLNKMLGRSIKDPYHYDLGYSDDDNDESFGNLFEEEDDDDQFDPMNDFDLEDLPAQFTIDSQDDWNPPKKSTKIIDGDESNLHIYNDSDEYEDKDTEESPIMPEGQFQRYSMSIFEKLLEHLENEKNAQRIDISNLSPVFSNDQINWCTSPVNENGAKFTFMMKDGEIYHNDSGFNADGTKIDNGEIGYTNKFDEDEPIFTKETPVVEIDDLNKIPFKEFYKLKNQDGIYFTDEDGNHCVDTIHGIIDYNTTVIFNSENFNSTETKNPEIPTPKNYDNMTREEIINEFNSSNVADLAREEDTTKPEKIESMSEPEGKLTQ